MLWPIKSVQRNSSPKAQWTERYIYYLEKFCTGTFHSNGRISETKRDILDPLAPKWPQRIGLPFTLSWKWPHPTFSSSFGLFSWKKALFRGVPGGPNWATTVQNMPLGPFSNMQKRNDSGKPNWSFPGMFCDLFHFRLFQSFSRLTK